MSGYYLFFRLCSNLNSTFPAKKLDEVRDKDLPSALDNLAQEWLQQHPGAVATVEEVTKLLTLGDDPAESYEVDLLRWGIDQFRRELGIHPDQPLFLRVAPLAGWGFPLPQPLFGGQVVSGRCPFDRAPDRSTADSALERIRRLAAKSFGGDWLKPHFGCCAESGFTKKEQEAIEITYGLNDLRRDSPSFIREARFVLDKVVEVKARAKETVEQAKPAAKQTDRSRADGQFTAKQQAIISALLLHHEYESPQSKGFASVGNTYAANYRKLCELSSVKSTSTIGTFFDKWLPDGGNDEYRRICRTGDATKLSYELARLVPGDTPSLKSLNYDPEA